MRQKAIAVVLGMSEMWLRRALKEQRIEPGRWGLERRGTQPIEVDERVLFALVLRFLRSRERIPFAIKAKISYNFLRWAARRDLYIPEAVRSAASLFDPMKWHYDRHARQHFVVLTKEGRILSTPLFPR